MINKQRLVQTFLDLVKIDSPTGFEKQMADEVAKRLKNLGGIVEFDSFGNVIGKFEGTGEPFMLNSHLDTVEPGRGIKPIIENDRIKSDGTTIIGGDPKAGVSIILETLESLREENIQRVPLEVVFTLGEENGLDGAIHLSYEKISSKKGFTFDGEGKAGNIDIAAPGYQRVDATITGRSAHAGVEPEKGISAIRIAAEIISKLPLGRIDHETTSNIGLINGGSARNAVPESVTLHGEIRSRNLEKIDTYTKKFENICSDVLKIYPTAKLTFNTQREFNPYIFQKDHPLIDLIINVFGKMGMTPNFMESGGGTDVNIFHTFGIQNIVVGTGAYVSHTTREYVVISEMLKAAEFCQNSIVYLSQTSIVENSSENLPVRYR